MGKSIVYEPAWNQKTLNVKLVDSLPQVEIVDHIVARKDS